MIATPEFNFQKTPVTLIIAGLCLALEVVCTLDPERRYYYYNDLHLGIWLQIWEGELWRPFTTTLLHGDFLHAAFNLYWLAVFGSVIENWLGSLRTLGLIVLLAYLSSLTEYVLGNYLGFDPTGGVGLSGVGYGLFGLLWVGGWHRADFREVVNLETVQLMLGWFVFCIFTTYMDWMRIGNLAHAGGLVFGMLIGLAVFRSRPRWLWPPLAVIASLAVLATLYAAPGHEHYEYVLQRHEAERQFETQQSLAPRDGVD